MKPDHDGESYAEVAKNGFMWAVILIVGFLLLCISLKGGD